MRLVVLITGLVMYSLVLAGNTVYVAPSFSQQKTAPVYKRVSKEEFRKKLLSMDNVQLIDVRTAGEFKGGTIEGAVNIDFMAPNFDERISKLDKTKPVMIFCQSGGRSAKALKRFEAIGFQYVLELEGGYSNW